MGSPASRIAYQDVLSQELAQVIGISESSVRRWVDEGHIDDSRTAGGHRRIGLRDALRFIRSRGMRVLRPELLC